MYQYVSDLEHAATIYFGVFSPEDYLTPEQETPETLLIQKDALQKLSEEAKFLIDILINLPDEMILSTGRVCYKRLSKFLQEKGWSKKRVQNSWDELKCYLKEMA
jgi:hypothetical protein